MANQMLPAQQHVFWYQDFQINKSQPLGHGSYGAVYKAKCDQLPCAAKVLHPTILDPADPGAGKIMERFQQECAFLESIRHPNIVQYLGMTRDPESRLPVLLMELLDESLTKMLECSQQSLAYYVQVDICHDIALAINYLHSNDIIHRDLSSNNVLMIAGRRAKVTDFGMSKLAGAAPSMTPLTMCPGTLAYMPPEALREPPRYTKKLDCFSEGVIMIQVCTRLWPEPGPRTQVVQDSRSLTGIIEMPVPEMHRRKNHIDLIDPDHALLPIITNSLKFQDKDRPASEELCHMLAGLKESREYRESVQTHHDEIQAKDSQSEDKDQLLLQQSEAENALLTQQLQDKDCQLQEQRRLHQEELSSQESELWKLSQQLKEQEQISSELQQIYHFLQRQVEQLQRQLSRQQRLRPPQPLPKYQTRGEKFQEREVLKLSLLADQNPHPHQVRKVPLNWRDGNKAPCLGITRGAAVVSGNVAYFLDIQGDIYSYNMRSKKWKKLPKYPHEFCSLAVVNDQLTAIGGYVRFEATNKLLSLQTKWKEIFPPMPTKRSSVAAVTTKEHLIVVGGYRGGVGILTTVEVMDTRTLIWTAVASLPHPRYSASLTICGDQLYMLGGWDDNGKTKSVLTCLLTELLQSSSSSSILLWYRVADAPAYHSACAAVNGVLLAVGGCDEYYGTLSSAIHKYNPTTNSWDLISNMPTARYECLVAVFSTNEVMVVGGYENSKTVEIANNITLL